MNNRTETTDSSKIISRYDDDNIPEIDLPGQRDTVEPVKPVEPLPEYTRPRKDGPGGEDNDEE